MSDQFRKRWDIERRRQKTLKPDYLDEIRLENYLRREIRFGRFEIDSEFRAKHPTEFAVARRNRDGVFSCIKDPIIFLRECEGGPMFAFFSSVSLEEFAQTYSLDEQMKSTKQLFRRLCRYAKEIKALLTEEIRHWPMRVFVQPPLPRQFQFSNKLGMAASVWVFPMES
jgi:hypothetical protein